MAPASTIMVTPSAIAVARLWRSSRSLCLAKRLRSGLCFFFVRFAWAMVAPEFDAVTRRTHLHTHNSRGGDASIALVAEQLAVQAGKGARPVAVEPQGGQPAWLSANRWLGKRPIPVSFPVRALADRGV